MFGNDSRIEIAVLQERFNAHEQIMKKVDTAIQTLSETNQNICKMLAVHDERITVQAKVDDDICKKVDDIETKVEGLYKFRWQIGGIVALSLVLVGLLPSFLPVLRNQWRRDADQRNIRHKKGITQKYHRGKNSNLLKSGNSRKHERIRHQNHITPK